MFLSFRVNNIYVFPQFHHLLYIWNTFWATPGFFHKASVLLKGPGWGPGKPRLGLTEEIPEVGNVHNRGKYDFYSIVHDLCYDYLSN